MGLAVPAMPLEGGGKTISFLTLWDDATEGPLDPKLNGYQRPIPGCACGTKVLRVFAQRVNDVLELSIIILMCKVAPRVNIDRLHFLVEP